VASVTSTGQSVAMSTDRNPHAGQPFSDDDATIAAALEDVCVPALMCSMVHLTGDPSWIRGDIRPRTAILNDYVSGLTDQEQAEVRARALPAIAAWRDAGCPEPAVPSPDLVKELMDFMAAAPVDPAVVEMFADDLHIDGADSHAITWADEIPAEVRKDFHVLVIGCGESGLLTGIRLDQAGIPYTIVEKTDGPGGTWRDNRYPGARVDIGSHFYCYSFEPSDHWSEYFCRQPELRDYFERVMEKYRIQDNCRFNTEVVTATWNAAASTWAVEVRTPDGSTEVITANVVVSATGALNAPKMPDIPGMDDFTGPSFHSARWPDGLDLRGKRVAQIGAGASGFQISPTIADEVEHLDVFQRTAQWMFPNMNYHRAVPEGDAWAMRHLPFYARWFRFLMFYPASGLSIEFSRMDPNWHDPEVEGRSFSQANYERRYIYENWITSHLEGRPDLIEKSMPHYPPSAKRMLQDNGSWLNCLIKPNVELIRTGIERVTVDGVLTEDGELHPADVIIYATGFRHNDYLFPMTIIGKDGVDLRRQWGHEPSAYLGISIPNFPNLFCLYGPGTNLAHGASLIFQSECQVNYVMSAIHELLATGRHAMEPKASVHDEYQEKYESEINQMVWAHPSVKYSHFKNPDGRIFTLSPWPIPQYWQWTRAVDTDDYEFV
jgi:4-hydroxyacetophenone monooxygenase